MVILDLLAVESFHPFLDEYFFLMGELSFYFTGEFSVYIMRESWLLLNTIYSYFASSISIDFSNDF